MKPPELMVSKLIAVAVNAQLCGEVCHVLNADETMDWLLFQLNNSTVDASFSFHILPCNGCTVYFNRQYNRCNGGNILSQPLLRFFSVITYVLRTRSKYVPYRVLCSIVYVLVGRVGSRRVAIAFHIIDVQLVSHFFCVC